MTVLKESGNTHLTVP